MATQDFKGTINGYTINQDVSTGGTPNFVDLVGTSTNDSAAAGNIGEILSTSVVQVNAVSLTTGTAANMTSVSLTAGDWDVSGVLQLTNGATTLIQWYRASFSTTSATEDTTVGRAISDDYGSTGKTPAALDLGFTMPTVRFSLAAPTTIYFIARSGFTVSTLAAYGIIRARRVR